MILGLVQTSDFGVIGSEKPKFSLVAADAATDVPRTLQNYFSARQNGDFKAKMGSGVIFSAKILRKHRENRSRKLRLSKILEDIDPILRDGIRSSLTIGRIIGIDLISK